MQDIRGMNVVTHAQAAARNIILNLMPKYVFEANVVSLNFVSIKNCTKYTIDIEYEYSFINLSSSKRDEDSTSEFDKFEAQLIKQNESNSGLHIMVTLYANLSNCWEALRASVRYNVA